jgi:hypothetical protein
MIESNDEVNPTQFEGLTSDQSNALISSGIAFMQAITRAYGTEAGLAIWEKITSEISDIRGPIFYAMLVGDKEIVQFRFPTNSVYRIQTIKLIRTVTGVGLREAKDIVDFADGGWSAVEVDRDKAAELRLDLRTFGYTVK